MLSDFAKSSFQIRRCGDVAEVVLGFVPSCADQESTYPNNVRFGTRDDKCVFQVQLSESVSAKNQTIPVNNNVPPDEESRAFGDEDESNKRNLTTRLSTAPSVASSSGSPVASSDSMSSPKRSYDESEDFTHLSDSVEEETVMRSERSGGAKRRRSSEVHNSSERRRREKINEKMRALQDLLPNCNKVDKASMLEEAIEYLKTLQFQLQTMSMGWLLPSMMFMGGMRQLPPYQFAPMGPPPQPQFLNTSPMLQGRPLPPFFNPLFGMPSSSASSTQSVPVTNPFEQMGCGLFSQSNSKNHSQL